MKSRQNSLKLTPPEVRKKQVTVVAKKDGDAAADKAAADRAAAAQNEQALRELRVEIAALRRAIEDASNKVKSGEQPAAAVDVATVDISTKIFTPNGDGADDFTKVSVRLNTSATALSVKVFNRAGKEVKELAVAGKTPAGVTIQRTWAGEDESGKIVPDGLYVIRISAVDTNSSAFETSKNVYVAKATVGQAAVAQQQPPETIRPAAPEQLATGATVRSQQPVCPKFTDVDQGHPYYDSITYVREKHCQWLQRL